MGLLIGYGSSATSTKLEHSSVALENIWRGREKERNPRHKHTELGELTGTRGQLANRSCGFQECAQTQRLSIAGYHLCLQFLSVCLTCNLHFRLKAETDIFELKTADCGYYVSICRSFIC